MTNNSDGLSPTLRPQLGVGFGRALLAAFGWDNGWKPDGVNDYLAFPTLYNVPAIRTFSIEVWLRIDSTIINAEGCIFRVNASGTGTSSTFFAASILNQAIRFYNWAGSAHTTSNVLLTPNKKYHLVINVDFANGTGSLEAIINGGSAFGGLDYSLPSYGTIPASATYNTINNNGVAAGVPLTYAYDEYRLYNRILTKPEILLNYNSGIGNNPCVTENLIFWQKFEQAEAPEALFPGGVPGSWTAGAYGIRDLSGQGNHAMQVNQSNDSTLGGNIQPF